MTFLMTLKTTYSIVWYGVISRSIYSLFNYFQIVQQAKIINISHISILQIGNLFLRSFMRKYLSISSRLMIYNFDISLQDQLVIIIIYIMHFRVQKMKNKGISIIKKVEQEKKVLNSHQELKLLDKVQGMLKLQTKPTLLDNLESIFIGKVDQKKKKAVYHLLAIWSNQSDIKDAIVQSSKTLVEDLTLYQQNEIISSRVYIKVQQYFSSKENIQLYDLLREMKLVFSYDRYWWKRGIISQYEDAYELQKRGEKEEIIRKIVVQVKLFKDQFLSKLFGFIEKIGLLLTNKQVNNVFITKIERITSVIQRQIYLKSISLPLLDLIKSSKLKGIQKQAQIQQQLKKQLPNYHFYMSNDTKSIDSLHLKYQQYQYLQQAHDYVQWMFPNHFKSMFNEDSYPLNYVQSRLFHSNLIIGAKILKSIVIFLDFWGIFFDFTTLKLQLINLERLENVLIYRTHNLLRLKRILAFLSIVGFREVALSLIKFLLEKTSQIKQLKQAHSDMIENEQRYGLNKLNNDKKTKVQCRLQLPDFPSKHAVFLKLQQPSKKLIK